MSLLFMDGFDWYTDFNVKYDTVPYTNIFTISSGTGRRGTQGITVLSKSKSTQDNIGIYKVLSESTGSIIIGIAWNMYANDETGTMRIYLYDRAGNLDVGGTDTAYGILALGKDYIQYYNYANTTWYTGDLTDIYGRTIITWRDWNYGEVKVNFDNVNGSIELHANDYEVLTVSGIDTSSSANNTVNVIRLYQSQSTNFNQDFCYLDDLYIANTSGTVNNDFLGNVYVNTVYPNASGTYSDFTLSSGTISGTPHYDLVGDNLVVPSSNTYTVKIFMDTGVNDGYVDQYGSLFYNTSTTNYTGYQGSYDQWCSYHRFQGVSIPRNAYIESCKVYAAWHGGNATARFDERMEDSPTGTTPITGYSNWSSRTRTPASPWATDGSTDTRVTISGQQFSPIDFTWPMRYMVQKNDWVETNNSVTFLADRHGTCCNYIITRTYDYDGVTGSLNCPFLEIVYRLPNEDDTYIQSNVSGAKETFKFDVTTLSGEQILGLQHNVIQDTADDGDPWMRLYSRQLVVISGSEFENNLVYQDLNTIQYTSDYRVMDYNPVTSGTWKYTDVEALELGITTTSGL